ncbi:MAG TPA: sugar ABC transporter permease [Anaerolineae bacterium]|nr:sugar ABC transporter permease [Anaerolineae bacterium]
MDKGKVRFAVMFLTPAFLLYSVFIILPMLASVYISLTDWRVGRTINFIGLGNFIELFGDSDYWTVLKNSFTLVIATVVFQVSLGLIFAYMLFWTIRGFRFFRSVFFMPVVVAPIAIGVLFSILYNGDIGPINKLLGDVGLSWLERNWMSDRNVVLYSVIFPSVWQYIGLYVVIFLAGLRGIPREYFDSASIDGASRVRMFFSIAIPLLREIIVLCVILAATGSIRAFDHSWALTKGGPGLASAYFATLVYKRAFLESRFGYGSAITVTVLVYSLIFTVLFRRLFIKDIK